VISGYRKIHSSLLDHLPLAPHGAEEVGRELDDVVPAVEQAAGTIPFAGGTDVLDRDVAHQIHLPDTSQSNHLTNRPNSPPLVASIYIFYMWMVESYEPWSSLAAIVIIWIACPSKIPSHRCRFVHKGLACIL
jgi:hypothetical protein